MTAYDISSLRTAIAATLTSYLGTYTLANGATTPAIAVRAYGEPSPAGQTVTGLEVVIIRDPEVEPLTQFDDIAAFRVWTVSIVDWGTDAPMETIAGRMLWAFPGSTAVRVPTAEGVGPGVEYRVQIRSTVTTAGS